MKIKKLEQLISDMPGSSPILAWSGGKDSSFLLQLMLELGAKFSVLTLHHLWDRAQHRFVLEMIERHGLTVFFYSPLRIDFTPPHVTLDYLIGGKLIKRVMDHVHAETRCGLDAGREALKERLLQPVYIWDVTVVGTKSTDQHPLVSAFDFEDSPNHRFIRPLWDWTDEEVIEETQRRGYFLDESGPDTGDFVACMACVGAKEKVFCYKTGTMIEGV